MKVRHRDDTIIIIEKPAGLPCLPSRGGVSPTLAEQLMANAPELSELPDFGLVHRLDNDTSGLVVVARTKEAYENLRRQFSEGKVEKEYLALVVGRPPTEGAITSPIAHHPRKKKKMIASPAGRPAHTEYKVVQRYLSPLTPSLSPQGERVSEGRVRGGLHYALVRVQIKTGVRHQIRVHLASIGHPLAGDKLYQNVHKRSDDVVKLPRHFLHASRVVFSHPGTHKKIAVTSSLPPDLVDALTQLERTR